MMMMMMMMMMIIIIIITTTTTPWIRIFLQKPIVTELVKKLSAFHGI